MGIRERVCCLLDWKGKETKENWDDSIKKRNDESFD